MKAMAEDQLGIRILGPTYFGTRQVGLNASTKEIKTPPTWPAIKLRMPGGDAWQFLGTSLGANPTPMAYAEVYTGLQTGAIDGQDNPLPNVENMKFYEVMKQIVLTSHLVGYDLLVISKAAWDEPDARATADALSGRRRRGHRLEPGRSISKREGNWRAVQGAGPQGLHAGPSPPSAPCAEDVSGVRSRQGLAGGHDRQDQRALSHWMVGARGPPLPARATGGRRCLKPRRIGWLARRAENVLAVLMLARRCSSPSSCRSSSAICSTCRSAGRMRSA
jgi:hypothetical protein